MMRIRHVYSGATLMRVLMPVALCMIFVVINVKLLEPLRFDSPKKEVFYGLMNSYDSHKSMHIMLYLMFFLIVTTTLGVLAYKKKLYKAIRGYIILNSLGLLMLYAWFHLARLASAQSLPLSLPTATFLILNFGALGMIGLHWKSPRRVHQFYLIMLAALTAIFLLQTLPDWTVWIAIAVVSAWDLIAVLTPCGPLKVLVDTANRRGDDNFPAILYTSSSYPGTPETPRSEGTEMTSLATTASSSLVATPIVARRVREVREVEGTIRLGMGDFVFYSFMIGNVAQTSHSLLTVIACFVANLTGLTVTLPVVSLCQTALPALPFPLLIAAVFYFSSQLALMPFTDTCSASMMLF